MYSHTDRCPARLFTAPWRGVRLVVMAGLHSGVTAWERYISDTCNGSITRHSEVR